MPTLLVVEAVLLAIAVPIIVRVLMDREVRRLFAQLERRADHAAAAESTETHATVLGDGIETRSVRPFTFVHAFGLRPQEVAAVHLLRAPAAFAHWPAAAQSLLRQCVAEGCFRGPRLAPFVAGDITLAENEAAYLATLKTGRQVAFVDEMRG